MKKIIIIGAGPAGLTAGYELLKEQNNKYEVVILEETNEIGGISKTVKYNGKTTTFEVNVKNVEINYIIIYNIKRAIQYYEQLFFINLVLLLKLPLAMLFQLFQ